MNYLYQLNNLKTIAPVNINFPKIIQDHWITNIFTIPMKNSIGTNDFDNAISSITFSKEEAEINVIRKDFLGDISGADVLAASLVYENMIYLSIVRTLVAFDIKSKKYSDFFLAKTLNDTINKFEVGNPALNTALVEIKSSDNHNYDPSFFYKIIKLDVTAELETDFDEIKISKHPNRVKKELILNKGDYWIASAQNVIYIVKDGRIETLNFELEPTEHVLTNIINEKEIQDLWGLAVHPTLPFAIVVYSDDTWLVQWQLPREKQWLPLIHEKTLSNFKFSPDQKWVTFSSGKKHYAIPIDENIPNYLGKPINIGLADIKSSAWIADEQSFVAIVDKQFYKWNLNIALHDKLLHQ